MQRIADVACRAIAYQNACFVVSVCGAVSDFMVKEFSLTDDDRAYMQEAGTRGGTTIYAPGGEPLAGPLPGGEGILYGDADFGRIVPAKIVHDYAGDYNRFDIFQLFVNGTPQQPSIRSESAREGAKLATPGTVPLPLDVDASRGLVSEGQDDRN
jgi:aliphatic nitrilase